MLDLNALKDGIKVSNQTMVQIFGAMIEDRDTLSVENWMGRYSGYIVDTAIVINSMRPKEDRLDEDDILHFAAHIAQMVYSKDYDKAVAGTDYEEFFKQAGNENIASS